MANKDRMQAYALKGVRGEIDALLARAVQINIDFPELTTLDTTKAALAANMEELDGLTGEDRPASNGQPKPKPTAPRAQPPTPRRGRPPKAEAKRKATREDNGGSPSTIQLNAWLVGRDTLAVLDKQPDGMSLGDIAERLKIRKGTAHWRLRVRIAKGHVLKDEATGIYTITQSGKAALATDRDSPDLKRKRGQD